MKRASVHWFNKPLPENLTKNVSKGTVAAVLAVAGLVVLGIGTWSFGLKNALTLLIVLSVGVALSWLHAIKAPEVRLKAFSRAESADHE